MGSDAVNGGRGTNGAVGSDPRGVLGIGDEATDEEIRAAYLQKIKAHPPERDPDGFEQIRDAFEELRDPLRRTNLMIESCDPTRPLTDLLDCGRSRRYTGPEPWLGVLKGR